MRTGSNIVSWHLCSRLDPWSLEVWFLGMIEDCSTTWDRFMWHIKYAGSETHPERRVQQRPDNNDPRAEKLKTKTTSRGIYERQLFFLFAIPLASAAGQVEDFLLLLGGHSAALLQSNSERCLWDKCKSMRFVGLAMSFSSAIFTTF